MEDDFMLPDGMTSGVTNGMNNLKTIHEQFGMKCKYYLENFPLNLVKFPVKFPGLNLKIILF